jgi:hypothetical protein
MTRVQLMRFRRRDRRHRWYRRLFVPACLIGPLFIVAVLTALDPSTSFARDNMWRQMTSVCMEYNAELRHLSPDIRFAVIAIPDDLCDRERRYAAVKLFHRICSLGGPELELTVYRINPEYVFIGNPADDRDAGELFEEVHRGIPSEINPMTLAWTRELVNGDPWE